VSVLRLEALTHAELTNVTAAFGPGNHVVVGNEFDGTATLIELAAGLVAPNAGQVLLDQISTWSNALTRQRIGSLRAQETLLPASDVTRAVALALRARNDARSAASVLDAAGLARFAKQRVTTLTPHESRVIALSIALSHPEPALLALHEPLGAVGLIDEQFVLSALNAFAAAGAVVLCTASRLEDAARLGRMASVLERGQWLDTLRALSPQRAITLRVHTAEPRRLAARLAEVPDISGVEWAGGQELLVHGRELELVAQSVVSNARAEAITITALKQDAPALEALAAARAGFTGPS